MASPMISVLGEGGDPCIVGIGHCPMDSQRTINLLIFPGDGFPFHQWLLMCMILTIVAGQSTDTFMLQRVFRFFQVSPPGVKI